MAGKTVSVRLSATVAPYKKAMAEAAASTSAFEKSAGVDFQKVGAKMQTVGKKMTMGVTLPLLAAGAGAVKLSMDFDASMSKITALVGIGAAEVDGMKDSVLQLAGETATAPQKLADALFVLTSAGLRGDDALSALEMSAKASAAGLGETNDIARAVAGAMNAYGPEALNAARATDILTATARAGNFETSQLSGALGRVLPFAKQAGASLEEVGGAVALLTRTNGNAAESITQVQALMRAFVVPTVEAATVLGELGMTAGDVRDSIGENGLSATLQMLDGKLGGNREQLGRLLGSSEAASAAFQILDADAQTITDTFGTVTDSVGMTDAAFGTMAETGAFKMQQAWVDIQTALIQVGEIIGPMAADVAGGISSIVEAFSKLPQGAQIAVVAFLGVIAAVGPLLTIGGKILVSFQAITAGLTMMRAAMLAHPILMFAGVAAAVGTALFFMSDGGKAARERVKELADEMRNAGSDAEGLTSFLMSMVEGNDVLLASMSASNITVSDLAVAVMAGGDAWQVMARQLVESAKAAGVGDVEWLNLAATLSTLEGETKDATTRAAELDAAQGDLGEAVAGTDTSARNAAAAALELAAATDEAAEAAEEATDEFEEYDKAIAVANETYDASIKAIEEWADGIDAATSAGADSFSDFSGDTIGSVADFRAELQQSAIDIAAWQANLLIIAERAGPEFAAHLAEMGEAGAPMVAELAADGDLLNATLGDYVGYSDIAGRDMVAAFDDVGFGVSEKTTAAMVQAELDIENAGSDLYSASVTTGGQIGEGIGVGISDADYKVAWAARGVVRNALASVRADNGIESPSRLWAEEVGQPIAGGIAEGIADDAHKIDEQLRKAIEDAEESAVNAADTLTENVLASFDALAEGAADRLSSIWDGIDAARSLAGIEESVSDAEESLSDASVRVVDANKNITDSQYALALAQSSGTATAEEMVKLIKAERKAVEEASDAIEAKNDATTRLQDANLRLTEATMDNILGTDDQREAWRLAAHGAGLTAIQVRDLESAYRSAAEAQASLMAATAEAAVRDATTKAGIAAEAAGADNVRIRFSEIVNQGAIGAEELKMIAGLSSGGQLNAMNVAIKRFDNYVKLSGSRAGGGPVRAGHLYEVGEGNVAEMLMSGGRQYMIPGNNGDVISGSQMRPAQYQAPTGQGAEADWGEIGDRIGNRAATAYARKLQQEMRAA